jgi:hypothetical protein
MLPERIAVPMPVPIVAPPFSIYKKEFERVLMVPSLRLLPRNGTDENSYFAVVKLLN